MEAAESRLIIVQSIRCVARRNLRPNAFLTPEGFVRCA